VQKCNGNEQTCVELSAAISAYLVNIPMGVALKSSAD